jgi:hypothetical protein
VTLVLSCAGSLALPVPVPTSTLLSMSRGAVASATVAVPLGTVPAAGGAPVPLGTLPSLDVTVTAPAVAAPGDTVPLQVTVLDSAGSPVAGAEVGV